MELLERSFPFLDNKVAMHHCCIIVFHVSHALSVNTWTDRVMHCFLDFSGFTAVGAIDYSCGGSS